MAPRDPTLPQLDFPQLTADIIRQLRLTGQVGLLNFLDSIRPVYIVAQREGALSITVTPPIFTSADITDATANNPAVNAITGDTGPLPAGNYDVFASITQSGTLILNGTVQLQHRDAANAVTLAVLINIAIDGAGFGHQDDLAPIVYTLALNERLRVQNLGGAIVGVISTVIAAKIRPTP